jgi:Flp pilus assembly secretin CpaC
LNFLVQQGDAVILAEPRLSCRSGGSARFVAGGELPIPITGALGTASVAFKEYGIKFDVSPQASASGVIAAKIATEISAINFEIAVKDVPGLTKRRAETDVNLRDSETLVIAGLLTDESARNMDRVAGASELPVLGPLFRSRQFRDRQTELVVFITPRFVQGVGAGAGSPEETLSVQPMREPTRFMPPQLQSKPQPAGPETVYEGAPQLGAPADAVPEAATETATETGTAKAPSTATPTVNSAATSPSEARSDMQFPPAARSEDRGTVQRYRVNRERLRMVE